MEVGKSFEALNFISQHFLKNLILLVLSLAVQLLNLVVRSVVPGMILTWEFSSFPCRIISKEAVASWGPFQMQSYWNYKAWSLWLHIPKFTVSVKCYNVRLKYLTVTWWYLLFWKGLMNWDVSPILWIWTRILGSKTFGWLTFDRPGLLASEKIWLSKILQLKFTQQNTSECRQTVTDHWNEYKS